MTWFLGATIGTMLDPVSLVGWIGLGSLVRRLELVALGALIWTLAMEVLVVALNPGYGAQALVPRLVAGAIVTGLVYGIATMIRRQRRTESDEQAE